MDNYLPCIHHSYVVLITYVVMYLVTKVKMAHMRALFMVNLEGWEFVISYYYCMKQKYANFKMKMNNVLLNLYYTLFSVVNLIG